MTVQPLATATAHEQVGGKAMNLARLMAAGVPVPEGFVLTNAALQRFVAEQEALPPDVDIAVMDGWQRLPAEAVIVRSSAVGEDSAEASFAGQLDSVPNVTSAASLRRAILDVWGSQWSARALAYQSMRGTSLQGMGVIVQRQVDAAVSGVLFTRAPQSRSHMLLEYCAGLGEALVSGAVNPGRVTIARRDFRWQHVSSPDQPCEAERLLLTDVQVRALGRLALDIERAFGSPQDIEWTIDQSGKLWVVQSRPITTAPAAAGASGAVLWSNANVNENFPQPISPLLYSVARAGYYHYFRNLGRAFGVSERRLARMEPALRQIIGVHGARMYYNLTSIHHVLRSAPFGDHLAASFDQFVGVEEPPPATGAEEPRSWQALEVAAIAARVAWQYSFLTSRVREFERAVDAYAAATHPARLAGKPLHELVADLRGFMDIRCNRWTNAALADTGSMVCYGLLQRILARAFPEADQQALHNTLLKALPDLVSGKPPLEMWTLSREIRRDPALRELVATASAQEVLERIDADPRLAGFNRALKAFVEQWGFRCSAELMLTSATFQEDPRPLVDLLKAYASMDTESPADLLKRQAEERVTETRRVLSALPLWRSLVVRIVLQWTQRSIQLRERARLKQALLYSRLRRVALALGAELVRRGRFTTSEDVFFLSVEELDLLASGGEMFPQRIRDLISLRRAAHAEVSAEAPPDSLRLDPGEYFERTGGGRETAESPGAPSLKGVGACGGRAHARAAVLLDLTQSDRLEAGDVLVTRQTDPGWGPIFPLISGLVIERGGMLSHGAIIAREFGIPSVVGVRDATRLIPHGRFITVDGDRGIVCLDGDAP